MTNKIRNKTGWMVGPGQEGDRARKTPETWRQKTGGVMHDHDHYRQVEKSVSVIPFFKIGEVVFGTGM